MCTYCVGPLEMKNSRKDEPTASPVEQGVKPLWHVVGKWVHGGWWESSKKFESKEEAERWKDNPKNHNPKYPSEKMRIERVGV